MFYAPTSDATLLKKTLATMGVMVGALVAFVGTLTLLVWFVVGRAVAPAASSDPSSEGARPSPAATGEAPTPAPVRRSGPSILSKGTSQPI